ncbi:PilM family type IVa pilus assembly protein TapM [Aeromonas piscicola]|uniref:PilM family type IVa pilus assembly protein TapM n=1 Tax=Aeromonas piscicola TaxID=600645 RepID=UPI0021F8BECC|nr:PilM family type IVa pilus assembly protein TapM [Aeromonas piscicola]MCW0505046.1 PilM family type IVa pilus assembly protein TapM [Aeromonas piscicola]
MDVYMFGLFNKGSLLPLAGIDFGSQSIKAVTIAGRPGKLHFESVAEVATPKGTLVDYQLQDIERVSQSLKTLKRLINGNSQYAATAVTGSNVITKVIQVDTRLSENELENQVQQEAEQIIPFPLDEVSLDFEIIGIVNDQDRQEVLLSAARTESVSGRVTALAEAGMITKVVDVGAHALGRAVLACLPDLLAWEKPVGVIDIGASAMTFVALIKGQTTYSRIQNFGGDQYSQALSSFYQMSLEEAELAKIKGSLPADYELDVLLPHINALLQQVRRNVQLFCSSSGHRELSKLVLTGGGSLIPGLVAQVGNELNCEVLHPDPFALFGKPKGEGGLAHGAKYMTALGLALRSFTPCQI